MAKNVGKTTKNDEKIKSAIVLRCFLKRQNKLDSAKNINFAESTLSKIKLFLYYNRNFFIAKFKVDNE
ncbi:hypothetical protein [Helicobacter sp. 23-1045]